MIQVWIFKGHSFDRGSEVRMVRVRLVAGKWDSVFPLGQWVVGNDTGGMLRNVTRPFLSVSEQVLHVGEPWEQFSFKYQDKRE